MFKDQVVVITGSARGLGFGMARRFGEDGARVVITDLNIAGGEQAAALLRQDGLQAIFAPLDVRDPAQSVALVDRLVAEFGHIDVLVNNAGVAYKGHAETLPLEQFDEAVSVMLSGAFYCSQAAGRQMLAQGRGVIINVASTGGYQYIEGRVAYSVPKAGLVMLTQALGVEWARRGVRVVGIAPGVVMTEMVQKGLDEGTARLDLYERRTPMRRLGTVEEIAEAVFWLASNEAAYVVAETLRVDGGWTAYQLF
jgi:NAD(P)-dependent dehydrogenase (short-subunit alcohol dehydrogenase family)